MLFEMIGGMLNFGLKDVPEGRGCHRKDMLPSSHKVAKFKGRMLIYQLSYKKNVLRLTEWKLAGWLAD